MEDAGTSGISRKLGRKDYGGEDSPAHIFKTSDSDSEESALLHGRVSGNLKGLVA